MEGALDIERMNSIFLQLTHEALYARKKRIVNGMMVNFFNYIKNAVILVGRNVVLKPDFVDDILKKYVSVEIADQCVSEIMESDNNFSLQSVWQQTVLIFQSKNAAEYAAAELRAYPWHFQTILMKDFLHLVIACEVCNPLFQQRGTWIAIKGSKALETKDVFEFELDLHQYGRILEISLNEGNATFGLSCDVKYEFASHALTAKTFLNASCYKDVELTVDMFETEKESILLNSVKASIGVLDHRHGFNVEELFLY